MSANTPMAPTPTGRKLLLRSEKHHDRFIKDEELKSRLRKIAEIDATNEPTTHVSDDRWTRLPPTLIYMPKHMYIKRQYPDAINEENIVLEAPNEVYIFTEADHELIKQCVQRYGNKSMQAFETAAKMLKKLHPHITGLHVLGRYCEAIMQDYAWLPQSAKNVKSKIDSSRIIMNHVHKNGHKAWPELVPILNKTSFSIQMRYYSALYPYVHYGPFQKTEDEVILEFEYQHNKQMKELKMSQQGRYGFLLPLCAQLDRTPRTLNYRLKYLLTIDRTSNQQTAVNVKATPSSGTPPFMEWLQQQLLQSLQDSSIVSHKPSHRIEERRPWLVPITGKKSLTRSWSEVGDLQLRPFSTCSLPFSASSRTRRITTALRCLKRL